MDIYGAQVLPIVKDEATAFLVYAGKELMTPIAVCREDAVHLQGLIHDLSPTAKVDIFGIHEVFPKPETELAKSGGGRPLPPSLAGNANVDASKGEACSH